MSYLLAGIEAVVILLLLLALLWGKPEAYREQQQQHAVLQTQIAAPSPRPTPVCQYGTSYMPCRP